MQNQTSPLILTFGVADPIGAVGVHSDIGVFAALGCQGLSVTTALLIGDSARVEEQQHVEPDWVSDQARVVLEDVQVAAFKIGALDHMDRQRQDVALLALVGDVLVRHADHDVVAQRVARRDVERRVATPVEVEGAARGGEYNHPSDAPGARASASPATAAPGARGAGSGRDQRE